MSAKLYLDCYERVQRNAGAFAHLHDGSKTWPLPWFGNLQAAAVLTVGVNPSAKEFSRQRWMGIDSPQQAFARARDYFDHPTAEPHKWFTTWENALNALGASYYDGRKQHRAAHVDLSPRATKSMRQLNGAEFLAMIEADLPMFIEVLQSAVRAKAIFLAGTVTSRFYMNEFLQRMIKADPHCRLVEPSIRKGKATVNFHTLELADRRLPVFSCSCSPSGRGKGQLVERVQEHQEHLSWWLLP